MTASDIELVDRLTRKRARTATALGIVFVATQGFRMADDQVVRAVDIVQIAAWAIWVAVLFVFLLYGGGLFRGKAVRALMNDENTEQNRRSALVGGFWATMATVLVCYAISFFRPVMVREALHVVVTVGIGAAMMRFGALERRAHGG